MKLESPDFKQEQNIPVQYTCTGMNLAPRLTWTAAPAGTKSFAFIIDDPDAPGGGWTHWIVYNIPATARQLPQNTNRAPRLDDATLQGYNDFRKIGYDGPCPPPGHGTHRYFFRLYALDTNLALKAAANRSDLEQAMQGHILAQAELTARFAR